MDKNKKIRKRVWPIPARVDIFSIVGFSSVVILSLVLKLVFDLPWLEFVVGITGILYVAVLAERNILNFAFGIINVVLYIILCYQTQLYGETILYIIDLILVVPAFLSWRKSLKQNESEPLKVKSKKLKPYWFVILPIAIAIFTYAYGLLLQLIGGGYYFFDALSSGVTIVATFLSMKQYREQWIGWIFVYIVSIVLWSVAGGTLMIVMSAGCLLFSIKGTFEWWKDSGKKKIGDKQEVENKKSAA